MLACSPLSRPAGPVWPTGASQLLSQLDRLALAIGWNLAAD